MNKKIVLVTVFAAVLALGLGAQEEQKAGIRFDLGFDAPITLGAIIDGDSFEGAGFFTEFVIPFPSLNLNYVVPVGPLTLGGGLRGYSLIIESFFWPNLMAELALGPFVVQAQFGGGAFLMFGIANTVQSGAVFFPDLGLYYQHKKFRIGAGALGVFVENIDTATLPIVFYASAKFIFD